MATAGRWRELTTGEKAKHAAVDAAKPIVLDAMTPHGATVVWADAMTLLKEHAQAKNLRPATIQQYELVVNTLKKLFPDTRGPADVTPAIAQTFAVKRMKTKQDEKPRSPRTVAGNIDNLSIVFGCWFRDTLKIIKSNPFDSVKPPKVEKKPPRVIAAEEQKALTDWLAARWADWRLPLLFLEVKAAIGCRIAELASAATAGLKDGRIMFASETTKGRKQRACRLPAALFTELQAMAGPSFVFQRFADELRAIHLRRGRPNHAKTIRDFRPDRLVDWLQDQAAAYFKASGAVRFKLHNLRGTAMSKARMAGVAESDAAIAFGCNAGTMRAAYLALDEEKIADDVFAKMQGAGAGT